MSIRRTVAALLAACALLPGLAAADLTVGGVRYEGGAQLRGSALVLNGAGVRYFGPFKVYAAGLYLGRKAFTAEEALALPGAKRMVVTMLRDIDASELGKMFTRGVEDNLQKGSMGQLIPGLLRMSQIFAETRRLQAGDSFTLDWIPGTGTLVSVRGIPQGEPFREPEFFHALLRIWLGPTPADWKLKDNLLGKPT